MIASIVGIVTGIVTLAPDDEEPEAERTTESAAAVRARHVRDCVRDHGLSRASERGPARPGDSAIERPADPSALFVQQTFASCDWPPRPGAFADGYSTITVTLVDGPGEHEATASNLADRIESRCDTLELAYSFGSMGAYERLKPFRARPGDMVRHTGAAWSPGGEDEASSLPFYPERNELVVLKNSKYKLDTVRCVSAGRE